MRAIERRRIAVIAGSVLALLAALYVVFWFVAIGQVRTVVMRWIDSRVADGYTIHYGDIATGGFPFRLRAVLTETSIAGPRADRPWRWDADRVVVELAPWNFRRYRISAPGGHAVEFMNAGELLAGRGTVEDLVLDLYDGGENMSAALRVQKLAMANTVGAVGVEELRVDAHRLGTASTDHRDATMALDIVGRDIRLPDRVVLPFGPQFVRIALEARIMGAIGPGPRTDALAAWRDAGGTLEIGKIEVTHGPVIASGTGTLALDPALQPLAAFTGTIQGLSELVDALVRLGTIQPRDAQTAKLVLAALGRRSDSGAIVHTVPITVQERRLFVGPIPIAQLPPIRW